MGVAAWLCYGLALFEVAVWLTDFPPYFDRGHWKHFKLPESGSGRPIATDITRNVFFAIAMANALPLFFAGLAEQRKNRWFMLLFTLFLGIFVVQQTRIWWIPYFTGQGEWYSSPAEMEEYKHNIAPLHKLLPPWQPGWDCVPDTEHTILYPISWITLMFYLASLITVWRQALAAGKEHAE